MDSPDRMVSLAFDAVTGRLHGDTSPGLGAPFEALYEIDPATGVTTLIGRILFDNVYALGFDQSGNLFGVSDATNQLIPISTATGNGSLIANLGLSFPFDIASRPEDIVMFLADSGTYSLYRIDTTTGATTLVGGYGSGTNVVGLAFGPAAIPEPVPPARVTPASTPTTACRRAAARRSATTPCPTRRSWRSPTGSPAQARRHRPAG
jgi:hypothetical protein